MPVNRRRLVGEGHREGHQGVHVRGPREYRAAGEVLLLDGARFVAANILVALRSYPARCPGQEMDPALEMLAIRVVGDWPRELEVECALAKYSRTST